MGTTYRRFKKLASLATASAFLFTTTIAPASAAALSWGVTNHGAAPWVHHFDPDAMKGNIAYVNNRIGAAILRIPAGELSNSIVQNIVNQAEVFAVYNPDTYSGYIFATRAIQRPNGDIIITETQVKPQNGTIFARDFEPVILQSGNAWWQFQAPAGSKAYKSGTFQDIQPSAFNTAVGLVMQHLWANHAWIATLKANPQTTRHTDNYLFAVKTTTTETVTETPVWTLAVPFGAGVGATYGYALPIARAREGTTGTQMALAFKDPHTIGTPTTLWRNPKNGHFASASGNGYTQQWAALDVPSGETFIPQGAGNTMPAKAWTSFTHSDSNWGVGVVGELVIAAVLAAATWGAGAALAPALTGAISGAMSSALGAAGLGTLTAGTGAALAGGTASLGWSAFGGGSFSQGANPVAPVPGFGSTNGSSYQAYAVNVAGYLKNLSNRKFLPGDSTAKNGTAPFHQDSQWDWRPSSLRSISGRNAQAMPGSVGPVNRAATYTPGDARIAGPLSLQKKQMQMHNGYPVLDTGGLPSGALAPQIP
ncbi:MAG TPA: hypothetical protein ENG84_07110 [Gammaproteobacteria bacterium]|nr:hypothetical protein [Gammaproteobacteria bacterium]